MGSKRKAQQKRNAEERIARNGPPVLDTAAWDASDTNSDRVPFYGQGSEMPWEQYDSGFEVAYDAHTDDALHALLLGAQLHEPSAAVQAATSAFEQWIPQDFYDYHLQRFLRSRCAAPSVDDDQSISTASVLYTPTLPNQIRVFELAAGRSDEALVGRLELASIEFDIGRCDDNNLTTGLYMKATNFAIAAHPLRKVFYTAVSYCWGGNSKTHNLEVGAHPLKITSTVDSILRRLRHPDHPVSIWIDQVCIDQNDKQDKQAQIAMMDKIYSRAFNTLIWLGEGPEDGAFDLLRALAYSLWGTPEHNLRWMDAVAPMITHRAKSMQALLKLFQSPWFQRTWIIQELALSRNAYLMFGSETITWSNFSTAAIYCADFDFFILPDLTANSKALAIQGVKNMRQLVDVNQLFAGGASDTMCNSWLEQTRYADSSDAIDKVYGILALCANFMPADYNLDVKDVYVTIAKKILTDSGLPVLLRNIDKDVDDSTLPSWVPDWSKKRRTTALSRFATAWQTAGGTITDRRASYDEDLEAVCTQALLLDDIAKVSEVFQNAELAASAAEELNGDLRQSVDFTNECLQASGKRLEFKRWCATIVAGRDESGHLSCPEQYVEVLSLLCDVCTGMAPALPNQTYTARQQKGRFRLEQLQQRKPAQTFWSLKQAFRNAMLNRRLGWSGSGEVVLLPSTAQPGDQIVILSQCPVPYVLRECATGRYRVLGECYVHVIMDGQYFQANHDKHQLMYLV